MAGTVNIVSFFEMIASGTPVSGKQGAAANARWKPLSLSTTTGTVHSRVGAVGAGAAELAFDGSGDLPATFEFGFVWADAVCQVQLVDDDTTGSNVILNVPATTVHLFYGTMLAAANETLITDMSTTLRNIDKIVIASTAGANYQVVVVD